MERTILHIDMDAYFASVEEKSNPFLKGKPIIVSGNPEARTTVSTANYIAREYGIKAGMPLREALRLCPKAEVVVGNSVKYLSTTSKLLSILKDFTPYLESYSIDEAFLDITGTKELFGGAVETGVKIKSRIKEELDLTCSVGIAPNKLLAKLASNTVKPDGLTCIKKEDVSDLLKNLPIEKLWGIGEKLTFKLNCLGIKTCKELADYPMKKLVSKFGVQGYILHCMGKGEYSSKVKPFSQEEEYKSMGHSYTLFRDTSNILMVESTLYRLCEQVGRRLRKDKYQGRTVTLILRFHDFNTLVKQQTLKNHINDSRIIYRTATSIMKTIKIDKPVRLIGVSVSNLIRKHSQISIFEEEKKREELLFALDKINDKFGEFTVSPGAVLMEKALNKKYSINRRSILKDDIKK